MKEDNVIRNIKKLVMLEITEKLNNIGMNETKEIYFHDIITGVIDSETPQDRQECIKIIDYTGEEKNADTGIIDNSSIDRYLVTMAYECLHNFLFNEDFIQELQTDLNNEEITFKQANKIKNKIKDYQEEEGLTETPLLKDNQTQFYFISDKVLNIADFKEPYYKSGQIINLSGGSIKILTCSNGNREHINRNALVLEVVNLKKFHMEMETENFKFKHKKPFNVSETQTLYRAYLMDRDKEIDIRELFKYFPKSIKENNYSLSPKDYIQGISKKLYKDKKELLFILNKITCVLVDRTLKENKKFVEVNLN